MMREVRGLGHADRALKCRRMPVREARIAGCANLAGTDADDGVQPATGLAVGLMKHSPEDLTTPRRVGATIPVSLNHDDGPIVSLDDSPEIWSEGTARALRTEPFHPPISPYRQSLVSSSTHPATDVEPLG